MRSALVGVLRRMQTLARGLDFISNTGQVIGLILQITLAAVNNGLKGWGEAGSSEQVTARVQAEAEETAMEVERTGQRPRRSGG